MDAKPAGLDGEGRLQALLKLAQVGAEYNHHRCLTVDEPHQEHTYPFHACQHPDCVLVRSVPAAPPRSEQFQRVLQEMEGAAGQYGLGETLALALHSWVRQLESLAVVPAAPPPQAKVSKDFDSWFDEAYAYYDGDRTPDDDRKKFKETVRQICEAEILSALTVAQPAQEQPQEKP